MSDETTPQSSLTVEERLAFLEEQNEGLKRVGKMLLGLVLLIGVLLVWTQSSLHKALYSEAVILGTSDMARATLTTTPNNHIGLLFYDHLGILPPSPQFGAVPYLDGVVLYDKSGKPRIVMGVNDKDQSILDVLDGQGKLVYSAVPRPAPAAGANGAAPGQANPPAGGTAAPASTAPAGAPTP